MSKIGLEIELLAYDKQGNPGKLGAQFNRFRKSFGNTINFRHFRGTPRYNIVPEYSFLSNEGTRYYLESPRTIEVATAPFEIKSGFSQNLVKSLKQGVNNILKHYHNFDFVPYSIHVNVESYGDHKRDRLFWNEVSALTLEMGTNSSSIGVGARFHSKHNIFEKQGNRIEIPIDGEIISLENHLEVLCTYYAAVLSKNEYLRNPLMILKDENELNNFFMMSMGLTEKEDRIMDSLPFYDRIISKKIGDTYKNFIYFRIEDLRNYISLTDEKKKRAFMKPIQISEDLPWMLINEIEMYDDSIRSLGSETELEYLYHYLNFNNQKKDPYGFYYDGMDEYDFNQEQELKFFKEIYQKLIARDRYFERAKKYRLITNGKILPISFQSIEYTPVLNVDKQLPEVGSKIHHSFGDVVNQKHQEVVSLDWNHVMLKESKKSKSTKIFKTKLNPDT